MSSFMSIRILFYLLVLCTIISTINSYHFYHSQDMQPIKQNYVQRRSVLWPKICVTMLQEYTRHGFFPEEYNNYPSLRPTRKCYPFDMR